MPSRDFKCMTYTHKNLQKKAEHNKCPKRYEIKYQYCGDLEKEEIYVPMVV